MIILDVIPIDKHDTETEYQTMVDKDNEKTVRIRRYRIGLEIIAELTFNEYCWVFGDKNPDKFDEAFDIALYEFIRNYILEEEEYDEDED